MGKAQQTTDNGPLITDDSRFLGDLYQDLSEAARKKYALLQTPEFVEEFILERTLEPALEEFGLVIGGCINGTDGTNETDGTNKNAINPIHPMRPINAAANPHDTHFKMIDPACGSGHFLLGSFRRILDRWQRREPGTNVRELVQRTLDSVHGVDVNPFAIAIARFRLLLAAMRACGIERLADAPAFRLNLVCGDSLLHAPLAAGGKKYTAGQQELDFALANDFEPRPSGSGSSSDAQKTPLPDGRGSESFDECDHAYRSENLPELKRLLRGGQYHAVVANPPYIVPRDKQLNDRYRKRFASCHRQYSLAVPFLEQIFRLAVAGGYTGQITSNSFMKREFGKKLIESFFPSVDLTHVIDTAGAYIPGHGTPTVILFGRHRPPMASTLRTVMGIRGEPSTPDDPARGLVWSAIVELIDRPQTTATRDRQGAASDSAPKGQPYVSPGQRPGNVSPEMNQNPEGVALTERGLEPPFQGLPSSGASSPRAMPWADIELPLRDEGEASRSALGARLQSHDQFVSVTDSPRELFHKHPWSIGGGGASELKEQLDEVAEGRLRSVSDEIGFGAVTREDDAYLISSDVCRRHQIAPRFIRPLGAVQFLLPRVVSP